MILNLLYFLCVIYNCIKIFSISFLVFIHTKLLTKYFVVTYVPFFKLLSYVLKFSLFLLSYIFMYINLFF